MSTITRRASITRPELADPVDVVASIGVPFDNVDGVCIPIYANTTERGTQNPSPVHGQLCYVNSTSSGGRSLQFYNGTAWLNMFPNGIYVSKSTTTQRASTTTATADPHLSLPVAANSAYEIECGLFISANASADAKIGFTFPSGSNISFYTAAPGTTWNPGDGEGIVTMSVNYDVTVSPTGDNGVGGTSAAATLTCWVRGLLVTGSTAGTLFLRWAQATSNAAATEMKAGSFMVITRIG